jgi:hypothetical protein
MSEITKNQLRQLNRTTNDMSERQIESLASYINTWEGMSLNEINAMNKIISIYSDSFIGGCSISFPESLKPLAE